jgi:hypothetical protein
VRCCVAAPAFTDMNCVRKHLSAIKGGRLAAAAPAQVVSLIIPDVPGDDPSVIAHPVRRCPTRPRSPMLGDPAFERTVTRLVATPQAALEAAAEVARQTGVLPLILGDSIEGEALAVSWADCSSGHPSSPTRAAALRADLRRRDDSNGTRPWPGRAKCGISACTGDRAEWTCGRICARCRYRWSRWCRESCRRFYYAGHDAAGCDLLRASPHGGRVADQRRCQLY